jgi:SAM-dependent methyltransferase
MASSDWWRSFFHGVAVDLWLRVPTLEQTRSEVDFLERMLRLTPPSTVLDVPCGGGRHALELSARGHRVTGVDYSTEFLQSAREQTAKLGATVTWEHREMRDLPWHESFDGLYCFGNSFGYLEDEGNQAFLEAAHRVLRPGGRLVIETGAVAEALIPAYQERRWYQIDDILFLIANRYNHGLSRIETTYTFVREGVVDERAGWQRVYTYHELSRLLAQCGFEDVEGYGTLSEEPFRLGSSRLYMVATKRNA